MAEEPKAAPAWVAAFLSALAESGVVRDATQAAGIVHTKAYHRRKQDQDFALRWKEALTEAAKRPRAAAAPKPLTEWRSHPWRKVFLEALAETSNVTTSAARANIALSAVYKLRRTDAEFAAKWLVALYEGYDNLEMELLGYLRDPQGRPKMDVTVALRLLTAHRETVERRRALTEEEDEQAVLDSIDRFIDEMRERRAANAAILIEAGHRDGAQ